MVTKTPMRALLGRSPVIPVLVVNDVADAAPLAEALVAGGLEVLEVTLRTPVALQVLQAMRAAVPNAVVGAGTVNTPQQMAAAAEAGAAFAVSPGTTDALVAAARDHAMPFLPGATTASEVLRGMELGLDALKFFPAEAAGGARLIKSWASPLESVVFCPTGGITPANARDYLKLPNVACVGGSWVTPSDAVSGRDWGAIEALARQAVQLGGS
ncbi:MAG: bifunctional 4-hydroxy-2-oxoglutarate aldolase/2-dehydro-3-deoxy-phosphogluconate aldolase [Myxococcota bacterium]